MDLAKTFSDRLFEICLLKNITEESLKLKLTKDFTPEEVNFCFNGEKMPSSLMLVALSRLLDIKVDAFLESGERIEDKTVLEARNRDSKIKHLEELLKKQISFTDENYKEVLKQNVLEALDKELITQSYAAYLLDVDVDDIRRM
jgi:hypothetical protein